MKSKLKQLYKFFIENRQFNHSAQENFYLSAVTPYQNPIDKIFSLLYLISSTQSQPKIDKLAISFRFFHENESSLLSFASFVEKINSDNKSIKKNYESLFHGMVRKEGWGDKTAALFVKSIYHMHNGDYIKSLKIWNDAPSDIKEEDKLFLPVDAVIKFIFKSIDSSTTWNFNNVNCRIGEFYSGKQIEVWDDLWFWGFITQKGSGDNRVLEWNENKYWMLKEPIKNKETIAKIKRKANKFINIVST
jgi:hypothetical protein